MQVVLLERVEKLGQIGDVVNVKPGFARNFLLPQNKALRATDDNIAYFNAQKETLLAANAARRGEAEMQAKKLAGQKFVLLRNASEVGMLFGSVGVRDVVEAAAEGGFTIQRAHVKLDQGIKTLGVFEVNVAPHPEVLIQVTVNIARSKEEAEEQFKTGQMYVRKPDEDQSPRRNSRRSKAEDAAPAGVGEQPEAAPAAEGDAA
jgi:large subunit ribosomal protein L9